MCLFAYTFENATITGDNIQLRIKDTVFRAMDKRLVRDDVTGELIPTK